MSIYFFRIESIPILKLNAICCCSYLLILQAELDQSV